MECISSANSTLMLQCHSSLAEARLHESMTRIDASSLSMSCSPQPCNLRMS